MTDCSENSLYIQHLSGIGIGIGIAVAIGIESDVDSDPDSDPDHFMPPRVRPKAHETLLPPTHASYITIHSRLKIPKL